MTTKHLTPERRKEIAQHAAKKRHDPNRGTHCCITGLKFTTKNSRMHHPEYPHPVCKTVGAMLKNVTRYQFERICFLVVRESAKRSVQNPPALVDLLRTPRATNSGE